MKRNTVLVIGAVMAILFVGVVLSQFASDDPDGLEFVAEQQGFDSSGDDEPIGTAFLVDYGGDSGSALAIAAVLGIAATAGLGFLVFLLARKRPEPPVKG